MAGLAFFSRGLATGFTLQLALFLATNKVTIITTFIFNGATLFLLTYFREPHGDDLKTQATSSQTPWCGLTGIFSFLITISASIVLMGEYMNRESQEDVRLSLVNSGGIR